MAGGNVHFLQDASASFNRAVLQDKRFDLARFYLGVTQTQLRKTDESIPILERLRDRGVELDGQVRMQLAYAHIKRYRQEDYSIAESELENVVRSASKRKREGVRLQAQALQVFLYSVMAGHLKDENHLKQEDQRRLYARRTLDLGQQVLNRVPLIQDQAISRAAQFDVLNGMGIAWMRIANAEWAGFEARTTSWAMAQSYYDQALDLRPSAVVVLQNIGTMRLLQAERAEKTGDAAGASAFRADAERLYLRSIEMNDHDQFPFYRLAQIAVAAKKRQEALDYIQVGRTKSGAVKEEEWNKVLQEALMLPVVSAQKPTLAPASS